MGLVLSSARVAPSRDVARRRCAWISAERVTTAERQEGQAAADCGAQIRRGEQVYTGYAYTDRVGVELGKAETAECHDVGEDAEGSVFSADPPQVTIWSVEGYSPDDLVAVRFDDDLFQVFFSESLPAEEVERIAEDLSDERAQ